MFLIPFYRSRTQPAKPSKAIVFTMTFDAFTFQKNMSFDDFQNIFRYLFCHWFMIRFGNCLGVILASLWHHFFYWGGDRFCLFSCLWLVDRCFIVFWSNMDPKNYVPPFCDPRRSQSVTKPHPRRKLDLSSSWEPFCSYLNDLGGRSGWFEINFKDNL